MRGRNTTFTVKTHKTKTSAKKHAKRQIQRGKVSVIPKRQPYVTLTAKVPRTRKPKKKAKRKKR